jgi:MFS family permease
MNQNKLTFKEKFKEANHSIKASFKMFPVILLGMLDTVIVLVPTYMENYLSNINGFLHLEQGKYTEALGYYGIFMMLMNFVGAYLGGKFKGRTLIITSMFIQVAVTLWYGTLMFQTDSNAIFIQWVFILLVISFAISALMWGPLWRIVKNYGTEELEGPLKEKKVASNNGVAGTYEALLGIILAGIGALLVAMEKEWHVWKPIVLTYANGSKSEISIAFLCLMGITIFLMILGTVLAIKIIKPAEDNLAKNFTARSLISVVANWKIWALAMVVMGIFMLQMELSAYINYLKNSLIIGFAVVAAFGIIRTYVMRFLLAGVVGKKADKAHSYIFILICGLFIGILLVIVAACLPGFGGPGTMSIEDMGYSTGVITLIQVLSMINLVILGGLTWTLVTLRWSPIGTELGVTNENYASVIAFLSAMGFSPGIYFKFIKQAIEKANPYVIGKDAAGKDIVAASMHGNQMVLLTCAALASIGLIGGLVLYINLYRHSENYKFKKLMFFNKPKTVQAVETTEQVKEPINQAE